MTPYEYNDKTSDGDLHNSELHIFKSTFNRTAVISVRADDATSIAYVPQSEVPAAALALYEAAGLPVPLILPRPEHTSGIEYVGNEDQGPYTGRAGAKVTLGWRGGIPVEVDPDEALAFAAHIAVNAEAAKANEPGAVEVERLAEVIRVEDYDLDPRQRWELARSILLAGYKREAGQ